MGGTVFLKSVLKCELLQCYLVCQLGFTEFVVFSESQFWALHYLAKDVTEGATFHLIYF